jgi:hypothetical protein
VETGTHAANSISIGEVESRTHTEGESQDHFESASRVFSNPNKCHALTFYFFRINKSQTVRWTLVSIERHVIDPAAPTGVDLNPPTAAGGVSATPIGILATAKDRIEVEQRARTAVLAANTEFTAAGVNRAAFATNAFVAADQAALPANAVKAALAAVDKELAAAGLLDPKTGEVTEEAKRLYGWERTIVLPTPGVMVKGCLDECDTCEPNLDLSIKLDLERKQLENDLLRKKIELLSQSQEYRCCPDDDDDAGVATEA